MRVRSTVISWSIQLFLATAEWVEFYRRMSIKQISLEIKKPPARWLVGTGLFTSYLFRQINLASRSSNPNKPDRGAFK
jgi:hypothetical protein